MGKVTNISEVRDLYDLIDLYANLDRNNDGLLGPDEVSADEIKAGDKGGTSSATYDVKDGFLSPWEVAQMRGFKWEDVRTLRIANHINGNTFNSINKVSRDVELNGYVFKTGTPLVFHPNGKVAQGVLARGMERDYKTAPQRPPLREGDTVFLDPEGTFLKARLNQPAEFSGIPLPEGTIVLKGMKVSHETKPIIVKGIAYKELSISEVGNFHGILARETLVPLTSNGVIKVSIQAGRTISWDENYHSYHVRELTRPTSIHGVSCPEGAFISLSVTSDSIEGIELMPPEGKFLILNGLELTSVSIRDNLTIENAAYAQPHTVKSGRLHIKVTSAWYRSDGTLASAKLAEDVPSPYGSGIVHRARSPLSFARDGTLIEDSKECFKAHYPDIVLTGAFEPRDIETLIQSMREIAPRVLAHIRGIDFVSRKDNPFPDTNDWGYVDPKSSRTIHVIAERFHANNWPFSASALPHEAAHVFALVQEEMGNAFKERWTRIAAMVDGDVYNKTRETKKGIEWKRPRQTGAENGPDYGCTRAYGCTSFHEDVATHVETIAANPAFYRQLIDEDSYFSGNHSRQRPYAIVYRKKLDLLFEYGFITEAKYREIVPAHKDIAAFCQTVNCR